MNMVRLLTIAAVGFALYAQTPPADVDGWDKIKWGMAIAEARSVYKIEAKPQTSDGWTLLTLPPVTFAGVKMDAQAAGRQGTEKITSVRLWSYFGLANSTPGSGAQDFDTLKAALLARYGSAASEETAHGENFRLLKSVRWTFPSTSILLTLEQSSSLPNLGNITLEFTARNR
jgi:hypothetical protein